MGGIRQSFPQNMSPQPTSNAGLHAQVLQQGMTELLLSPGDGQKLESHSPPRYGHEAAPSHLGRVCSQHCQPGPSSPSLFPKCWAFCRPHSLHVSSSVGTNLAAVTKSKEKSRLQITPWACNQENASIEQSHLPTFLPLGFAGGFLSQLFTAVVMI